MRRRSIVNMRNLARGSQSAIHRKVSVIRTLTMIAELRKESNELEREVGDAAKTKSESPFRVFVIGIVYHLKAEVECVAWANCLCAKICGFLHFYGFFSCQRL